MMTLKIARLGWLHALRGSDREAYEAARAVYLEAMYAAEDWLFACRWARISAVRE